MGETFQEWRARGERFGFGAHSIFFRRGGRGGDGPALLCIHGLPTASWDWHKLWPMLDARFARVFAPDMLGFGWSDKPRAHTYSIAEQADLHEALLRAHGVGRVRVLAHDYGDTVAQELLARHEERAARGDSSLVLEAVCFLNGGLFPETHRPLAIQRLMLTPLGPLLSRAMTRRAFARSFASVFGPHTKPTPQEVGEFYELMANGGGRGMFYKMLHYIPERRAHRERWVGALVRTGVPLRLVDGPEDPVSGAHLVARYRELVPRPDVVVLDGLGHYPHVEDSEAVWRACEGLLSG